MGLGPAALVLPENSLKFKISSYTSGLMDQKHSGEETDIWVGPSEMVSKSFPQKATIKLDKTDKTIKGSKK